MSRYSQFERFGRAVAALVASALMFSSPAVAETVLEPDPHSPLLRTETDGFVHYALEDCPHERGLAAIRYGFIGEWPKTELTDICFDRESGELISAEPVSGLTLVEGGDYEYYHVIVPDTQSHERVSVSAGAYESGDKTSIQESVSFQHLSPHFRPSQRYENANHLSVTGFLFRDRATAADIAEGSFQVSLQPDDHWQSEYRHLQKKRGGKTPIVYLEASGDLTAPVTRFAFKSPDGSMSKGTGTFELHISADGTLSGSGELSVETTVLAGAHPHDWKETHWKISDYVGYLVGADGQEFHGLGYITGEVIDHDGFVHQTRGSVDIRGLGPKYMQ
ncbi:hypothetical protein ACFPOD_03730 [Nitratireductor kimnyeongensis]|uniref:Uncharacterized protein n=1 Tax=Nitratireductor kimnyeongensis TaxID=430679 RepID=A0ABW0T6X6_9HYPH|nr:hypothetical protein [Nitratireductor kimnyeongensis]QZZ34789.1 hypothetical protein KW403_13455 [Nitratireductor kimnyeongensis]